MKCAKCGAELKLGSIYCSLCGQEAQIVSDSSLLEEELLRELLKDENKPVSAGKNTGKNAGKNTGKSTGKKSKKNHLPLIITLSSLVILAVVAVVLVVAIRNNNNHNSYDYQMEQARSSVAEQNYVKALTFYKRALELKEDDLTARQEMVEVYIAMEEEKAAISLLHEIIEMDGSNKWAYQTLIELYHQAEDYQAIIGLKEGVEEESILELFADYTVLPPAFSLKPGTYPEYITVELTAEPDCQIYYTTDGTDPTERGTVYEKPIVLEEQGSLDIRMAAVNELGLYSEIEEGTFTVKFKKPSMAKAIPDRGSFTEPSTIELVGTEGSRMYYTWDGTDPTVDSQQYTEPIPVPEGNNILSVILVDKYGMISDVLKCNYEYFP